MAKKNKGGKRRTTRRRRRISGIGSGNMQAVLMNVGGIAAGAFLGNAITKIVAGKLDAKILGAAKIAAGAFLLPKFMPGAMGAALGNGLMAIGSIELLQSFNVIKGIGEDGELEFAISGTDNLSLISGDGTQQLISGADDYEPYNNLAVAGTM
jgi:hypothetical protein